MDRQVKSLGFGALNLIGILAVVTLLAALAITAFFLSAIALRKARLDGFQSLRTSLSQAINTYFADQRRDISAQAELQTVRYAVTELSSGYEHLIEDLDAAGFKVDPTIATEGRLEP